MCPNAVLQIGIQFVPEEGRKFGFGIWDPWRTILGKWLRDHREQERLLLCERKSSEPGLQ